MKMTKITLQVATAVLLLLMAFNAYLAVNNLWRMQKLVALTIESSRIQTHISTVLKDMTDMETGQRGFLLTDDPAYLQPYDEAKTGIATDFADLRTALAQRAETERSSESQVESLANSKRAEMERSIILRQQGYRHRAFVLVNSNEGREYMDKARSLLNLLAVHETSNFKKFDQERNATLIRALEQTIAASSCLLILTACLFGLMRRQNQGLERNAEKSRQDLVVRDLQLAKLTSILSNQARSKTSAIEANARLLLQNYGGFLPRQGHECAEQIKEASVQMERLRQDLVGSSGSTEDESAAVEFVA